MTWRHKELVKPREQRRSERGLCTRRPRGAKGDVLGTSRLRTRELRV